MGTNTKQLRTRIKSVNSTLHLTKAMGLVASSKIRRATEAMNNGRKYAKAVEDIINGLTSSPECAKSAYMRSSEGQRVRMIVIAGDRGLAGGYNANVFRTTREFSGVEFIPIGKRACDRFGKNEYTAEYFTYTDAKAMADELCEDFKNEKFDKLGIISTKYISMMSQEATYEWILPLERSREKASGMIFEPDELTMLNMIVSEYVAGKIIAAVRESFASEVAARRCAMDSAGKNASEMIDNLQLQYNRARQSAITQEITEIVAGSGS